MAVYKDEKRGTWYCDIKYIDDSGKRRGKTKRGFTLKREALDYEANFRTKLTDEHDVSLTFRQVFNAYLDTRVSEIRKGTFSNYHRVYNRFLADLSDIKMNKLQSFKLQKTINHIKNSTASRSYKNEALRLLKTIIVFCNDIYGTAIKTHFITSVRKTSADVKQINVWTNQEFDQFIKHVPHRVYKAFFIFLFKTGCRRGEAMALLNSDIKGNRVTINKTLRSHKIGVLPTKTIASIREILIDDKTLQLLNEFRYGDYVFGGAYPLSSSSIQRVFDKAIIASGVKRIRLHDLRHSHATILINSGANIVAVSKRLGHSSINMTLQVYTHLLDKTESELLKYL